jgi:rubrerythrin
MSIPFNADEIFEIAEQIERNGARFYRRAAEGAGSSRVRKKLLDLAAREDEHGKVLAAMRAGLSPHEKEPTLSDPWGEALLYLKGIADGNVFDLQSDPAARLTGKETAEEVLRTAIGHEKDSIVFYLGMKEVVPERLGRDRIDAIIQEEMGHMSALNSELASLRQ